MKTCPVCAAPGPVTTVVRPRLPAMQNAVHRSRDCAIAAAEGAFSLAACRSCGFAWNAAFDPARLAYDDSYDNAVPSAVMARYYDEIADYLGRTYDLANGYVVDVGCGNGTFLKALVNRWPGCRAIGVDPALAADEVHSGGRVCLRKGVFDDVTLAEAPSLIVCRHVLEHIQDPVAFAEMLRRGIGGRSGMPLFVEVPDLDWIVANRAFWDFCYEHCNYFGEAPLATALSRAGFVPTRSRDAFGGQYRWMEARLDADAPRATAVDPQGDRLAALEAYAAQEREEMAAVRRRLAELKSSGALIAIWGMATKGIVYSLLVDPESTLIDVAVDVNTNKQRCFVPTSGRAIEAPEALQRARGRRLAVIVMNMNYAQEIRGACEAMGLPAELLDATGRGAVAA